MDDLALTILLRNLSAAEVEAAKRAVLESMTEAEPWVISMYGHHDPRLSSGLRSLMAGWLAKRYPERLAATIAELNSPGGRRTDKHPQPKPIAPRPAAAGAAGSAAPWGASAARPKVDLAAIQREAIAALDRAEREGR